MRCTPWEQVPNGIRFCGVPLDPLLDSLPMRACSMSREGQQLLLRIPLQSICANKLATLFPNVFFQDCSNCEGHVQERARKKLL